LGGGGSAQVWGLEVGSTEAGIPGVDAAGSRGRSELSRIFSGRQTDRHGWQNREDMGRRDSRSGDQLCGSAFQCGDVQRVSRRDFTHVFCSNCSEERVGLQELTPTGHSAAVTSVRFSRDGKWVVSGSDDKLVKIWDTATFKEVCPLCRGRFGCGAQEGECRCSVNVGWVCRCERSQGTRAVCPRSRFLGTGSASSAGRMTSS